MDTERESARQASPGPGVVGAESLVPGYEWIVIHPRYLGGKPAILGRRISVSQILEDFAAGWTSEDYESEYDVPREATAEALRSPNM